MSFSILIPPLALSDTQDLLRQVNIIGKRNVFVQKLQHFFKGRQEYIQQILSEEWPSKLRQPLKKFHKITIPIPEGLREQYNSHLKKLSKKRNNF